MAAVDPARLAPMMAAYAVYLAIFVIVGLTVSTLASYSRPALAVLLGFWAVNCFLTPRLVADAAEQTYSSPAAGDFWRQVAVEMRGAFGHSDNHQRVLELKRRSMERYGFSRVEDLPVNFQGLRLWAGEEHDNQFFDQHFGSPWRTGEAQEHLHHWAALASPFLAVGSISMGMAGTDLAHLWDFTQATEQHRRLNKAMNLNLANNSRTGENYYFAGQSP
jgi:ABC-2 type transport system permease protein